MAADSPVGNVAAATAGLAPAAPGDALFVAGYDPSAVGREHDPRLVQLTRLASVLLASTTPWRLRRLASEGGDRDAPSRGNVRRELDAMFARAGAQRLIIIAAPLTRTVEGLALACAPELGGFREDSSVPLEWIGLRLRRAAVVPTALILITTGGTADARAALDALGVGHAAHVVAVDVDAPAAALAALIDAIEATAIDPATGAVTPRSLAATLGARATAAVHPATDAQALVRRSGGAGADAGPALPGGFRLGTELGRGRFGVVYRARQALTGREVAIKILAPGLHADARAFATEVQALARVDHPGVVRVLHADTTVDGRPFLAMDLVSGTPLTATIGTGLLAPGLAHDLGRQLVGALAAAHAAGVIHGDVSPDNVLVAHGPPPRVVLIDFGMARLHSGDAAAGGTGGYLAPEVLGGEATTPRSDVFAAAMVLLRMLVGPAALGDHRAAIATLPPGAQRAALTRALDPDPAARFADAESLASALGVDRAITALPRPPFRMAAPFGEDDRGDFHGRAAEVERLLEQVLFRTAVAYVAPSGTGKTSTLRAGLIPRLRALDIEVVYVACRAGVEVDVAALLGAPGRALPELLAERVAATPRRLVVLIDQIEAALTDAHDASRGAAVLEQLDPSRWPSDAPVAVVWSVREEYLARLLDRAQRLAPGLPIERLGPLTPAVAREVIVQTLAAREVAIAPALLDALIADLTTAAASLAAELGWGDAPAVYPPHLQLAGSVLFEARGAGPLDRALYDRLGGLATILREHLRRVLEDELAPADVAVARALLQALVSTGHLRTACAERELIARASPAAAGRPAAAIVATLHYLRDRGVVVATPGGDGEPVWDLAHDSLVARVEAWIDATDLARRRALELVRHHLRHARTDAPSRLSADELREVVPHVAARDLAALDDEWRGRSGAGLRAATTLVAASRAAVRRRRGAVAAAVVVALGVAGFLAWRWQAERELRRRQIAVRDRDLGQSMLVLRAFDWDPVTLTAADTTAARFTWTLVRPDPADDTRPGPPFASYDLRREPRRPPPGAVGAELIIARGGPAVLVIDRVDRAGRPCTSVLIPIRRLPGYRDGAAPAALEIRAPTCEATLAGMIEVEAGPFIGGGVGEPPSEVAHEKGQAERSVPMARYRLDRTEMPHAFAQAMAAALAAAGYALPLYPDTDPLFQGGDPPWPITAVARRDAALLCAMAGKRLPSSLEWQKALRGGVTIGGQPNPYPRRNLPWGPARTPAPANLKPLEADRLRFGAPVATGGTPGDVGPYGHRDLAGNVSEWTTDDDARGLAIVRGGNWAETEPDWLVDFMAIDNPRAPNTTMYHIGFRCAVSAPQ